ncbi:hypothetical protein HDE78_001487 [Rhodanobacter sp. K2T2]|nr:hypothetical protein [Rhodanobacter sp. K2T2]
MFDKIWIVDVSQLNATLLAALGQGKAAIHDGVAYWAAGSGRTGVIQHLPFIETTQDMASKQLMSSVQALTSSANLTTILTAAASTSIIVGVIIVQTRYLAGKIDEVRRAVGQVSQKIDEQNTVFYMERIASYLGDLETCKFLMSDRQVSADSMDLITTMLPKLMSARNQNLGFIANLLTFADDQSVSLEHVHALTRFVQAMLDVIPSGIHLEYLMAARAEKIVLGEEILADGSRRYTEALDGYRTYLNALHKRVVAGKGADRAELLTTIEAEATALFHSESNKALLQAPPIKAAPHLRLVA